MWISVKPIFFINVFKEITLVFPFGSNRPRFTTVLRENDNQALAEIHAQDLAKKHKKVIYHLI